MMRGSGRLRGVRAGALAAVWALVLGALGCDLPRRALSSPREYEAYRATRASYTPEARLGAGKMYLGRYPEGRFADEVRRRFEAEEQAFYASRRGTTAGLEEYLQLLPDGPHAAEASMQLVELEKRAAEGRSDALVARGRSMERRLALAAASRRQVVDALVGWISALASNEGWGRPTWEQGPEVIRALRTEPGAGRCDELGCQRGGSLVFQVPVAGGGLEERAATFDLALVLERGAVVRGVLRGPALFSRFYEAARGQALSADALLARAEAVSHAQEVVTGAFEAVAPGAQCDRGITPPVILRRECGGWRVVVKIGDTPADDDVLEVEGPRRGR